MKGTFSFIALLLGSLALGVFATGVATVIVAGPAGAIIGGVFGGAMGAIGAAKD